MRTASARVSWLAEGAKSRSFAFATTQPGGGALGSVKRSSARARPVGSPAGSSAPASTLRVASEPLLASGLFWSTQLSMAAPRLTICSAHV